MNKSQLLGDACACAFSFFVTTANAALVVFEWQSTSFNSTIPGLNNGDLITINVFADNGSSSIFNQTWNNVDITSAMLTSGSYMATFFPPTNIADPIFQTDALGNISLARLAFTGINPLHFDTLGGANNMILARNLAHSSIPNQTVFWVVGDDTFDASKWTVGAVPVPAAMWLFSSGLLGLIGVARRKRS